MKNWMKLTAAHVWQVLCFLFSPSNMAEFMEATDSAGYKRGFMEGMRAGATEAKVTFARMTRQQRRAYITGAVKMFGRKPQKGPWKT